MLDKYRIVTQILVVGVVKTRTQVIELGPQYHFQKANGTICRAGKGLLGLEGAGGGWKELAIAQLVRACWGRQGLDKPARLIIRLLFGFGSDSVCQAQ